MSLFELDYTTLSNLDKKTYKLSEVKDRIIRVAFDIVRLQGEPIDELWEIQSADDGDYIVARYNSDDESAPPIKQASAKTPWEAIAKEGEVHLFYKNSAFTKFAHDDANTIADFLPTKLSTDQHFVEALFATLTPERQTEIKTLYPELF
jgi:hypothetical protein